MWLSQRKREMQHETGGVAQVGRVTLPGDPAGVYLAGERREVPVFGPGGYCWRPGLGEEVLVLKTGAAGESPCVAGVRCRGELAPGEVRIAAEGGGSITLGADGTIRLDGTVLVNGAPLAGGQTEGV